jgi:hypothetical protein
VGRIQADLMILDPLQAFQGALWRQADPGRLQLPYRRATTKRSGFSFKMLFLFNNSGDIEDQTVELGSAR